MNEITSKLDEIQKRADAATPGQWKWDGAEFIDYGEPGAPDMRLYIPECSWLTGGAFMMGNDLLRNRRAHT